MTETLGDLLRRSADAAPSPHLDVDALLGEAGRRQRRRRFTTAAVATAAVGAVVVGSFAVRGGRSTDPDPEPAPSPSRPTSSSSVAVDTTGTRPLVYAEGRTVHVGEKAVQADAPPGFIEATDDGAVFEATLDHTLWFTDGTTTTAIGTTPYTATPTWRGGVWTGDSGSLVVWGDVTGRLKRNPAELVVFDTSRLQEVGRIPRGNGAVLYVDEDEIYLSPRNPARGVSRFDVASGQITKLTLADLDALLSTHARILVADLPADLPDAFHDYHRSATFTQVGWRLVHAHPMYGREPRPPSAGLFRANGDEVRLRLPAGYSAPGPDDEEGGILVSQWLDDDTVALWSGDGGGDLPAQQSDVLVCDLAVGVCRVAVPRTEAEYVLPFRPPE